MAIVILDEFNEISTSAMFFQFQELYGGNCTYSVGYLGDAQRISLLKKALKNKHINPGLKVQYAKELQNLLS